MTKHVETMKKIEVLNLVINGLPSILNVEIEPEPFSSFRFKPCYKWITFNT